MILPVLQYPDPRLKRKSQPVEEITPEIRELAENMIETMYARNGVGLAAPQIGETLRLIVVDVGWPEEGVEKNPQVYVNPELSLSGPEVECEEGCLSVADFRSTVRRLSQVKLRAQDLDGNLIELDAEGFLAVCLQHECDHLDGKLFIDHISLLKRMMYDKKLNRQKHS